MNRTVIGILAALGLMGIILMFMISSDPSLSRYPQVVEPEGGTSRIVLYCAASNRQVVEAIRERYAFEYGHQVEIQYGPSQTLLSSIEANRTGDLYLPADDSYLGFAKEKGLVREIIPLAEMRVVVAVKKGNPLKIESLKDLLTSDVRVVQANPDAAAVGKLTKQILEKTGMWSDLAQATLGYRNTVTDAVNDVVVGAADAAIAYDAVLSAYPDLEGIEIPELADGKSDIMVGVLADSEKSRAALHFARYLAARDRGQEQFEEFGFRPVYGDPWADTPEITIFAGSMLQPAIEKSLIEFENREGVSIHRVYNSCGILIGQIEAGQQPDAFFATDTEFMQRVKVQFTDPIDFAQNELVIIVPKGNKHGIKSLKDLANPGLRVGIGHEKQCALGWLTQQTLNEGGVQQEVMSNVTTQTSTGDKLVSQLKAGTLNAAVVYLSNATRAADQLDAIRIPESESARATQTFAIAKKSKLSQIAYRLKRKLQSEESQKRFVENGFSWGLSEE